MVGERYTSGVIAQTDVLDAEVALLQAELDRTRALATTITSAPESAAVRAAVSPATPAPTMARSAVGAAEVGMFRSFRLRVENLRPKCTWFSPVSRKPDAAHTSTRRPHPVRLRG